MICLHQGDAVNLGETPGTSGRLGMSECKPPMCVCFAGVSVVTVGGWGGAVQLVVLFGREAM